MLFQERFLDGIRSGAITLAFRRWRRPTVRSGGTLLTPIGQLAISAVTEVSLDDVSAADARRAGYESLDVLRAALCERTEGTIYRIELGPLRADPRVALRQSAALTDEERGELAKRLARLDAHSAQPWTSRVLQLIASRPGVRAGDLCLLAGQEKDEFKTNVRKLKTLGLTESLDVGYRLSPRGTALLNARGSRRD